VSKTSRNGIEVRPSWNYGFSQFGGQEAAVTVEMLESCRNAMEQVRDELRKLNAVFACTNFQAIPGVLRAIRKNTAKKKKKP